MNGIFLMILFFDEIQRLSLLSLIFSSHLKLGNLKQQR